jgi:hypothetical protein
VLDLRSALWQSSHQLLVYPKLLMRFLLPLLLCLSASAQIPIFPYKLPSGAIACSTAPYTVGSGTLIFDYTTCGTVSITNTVANSLVTNWFDLSASANHLFKDASFFAAYFPPTWRNAASGYGPSGNPCVEFVVNSVCCMKTHSDFAKAQPLTYFFALSITNQPVTGIDANSRDTIMDSSGTGRNLAAVGVPTASSGVWNAGASVTPPTWNDTNWVIHCIVFDGASSVWFTNGPAHSRGIYVAGNPSTGSLGTLFIGADNTGASGLWAKSVCILGYTGHLFTNDMQTIEGNLQSQFGL